MAHSLKLWKQSFTISLYSIFFTLLTQKYTILHYDKVVLMKFKCWLILSLKTNLTMLGVSSVHCRSPQPVSLWPVLLHPLIYWGLSGLPQCNLFLFSTKGHSHQLLRLYHTDVNGWMIHWTILGKYVEENRHGLF